MSANPALDLAEFLEDSVAGWTVGTNVFANQLPSESAVATAVALIEEPGEPAEETLGSNAVTIEHCHLKLVSRSTSVAAARANAVTARTWLVKVANETIESTYYRGVTILTSVFQLPPDEGNKQPLFCFNLKVEKAPS